jgi:CHASE3 domain sensor protein
MKNEIKHLLLDPQIANAKTAKREQILVIATLLALVLVIFVIHAYAQGE